MPKARAKPLSVYFAAPLFTQAERRWNAELARRLEAAAGCKVLLPQTFGAGDSRHGEGHFAGIFQECLDGVKASDALLVVVDGADADSGTSFEMGYAHALGKPTVCVRTDFREQQDKGTNLMLAQACQAFVHRAGLDDDLEGLVAEIADALARVVPSPKRRRV